MNKLNPYTDNYPSTHHFKFLSTSYVERLKKISEEIWTAYSKGTPTKLSEGEFEFIFKCLIIETLLQAKEDEIGSGSIVDVTSKYIEIIRGVSNASNHGLFSTDKSKYGFSDTYQSHKVQFTVSFPGSAFPIEHGYQYVIDMLSEETPRLVKKIIGWFSKKVRWLRWHKISPPMRVCIVSGMFGIVVAIIGAILAS